MKITSYNHHVRRLLSFREALVLKPRLPDSIEPSLLSNQSFRVLCETAGTFSKPRRGGCPHPPGWGLFSRSRTESASTHLSFRGAPRRGPAFKYLSFRIRFSGEESAFCRGAPFFRAFCERVGTFPLSRTESAFTYLSIGGAPRLEPAFIYLSFRIRFSGEE